MPTPNKILFVETLNAIILKLISSPPPATEPGLTAHAWLSGSQSQDSPDEVNAYMLTQLVDPLPLQLTPVPPTNPAWTAYSEAESAIIDAFIASSPSSLVAQWFIQAQTAGGGAGMLAAAAGPPTVPPEVLDWVRKPRRLPVKVKPKPSPSSVTTPVSVAD